MKHEPKPPLPADLLAFARDLRKNQTDAEKLVWSLLRSRRIAGYKFRRQHPLDPCILDFYCDEKRLAIELDGGQHNTELNRTADQKRTRFIEKQAIRVLRFWNHDVLQDTDAVLEAIWNALHQDTLTPNPSPKGRGEPTPSLPPGEGLGEGVLEPATSALNKTSKHPHPGPLPKGEGENRGMGEGVSRVATVRYPRIVPKNDECAKLLKKRTLTNLYNERPTWLDLAHKKLDAAVFAAYGWDSTLSDDDLLAALLALNLARAAT